MTRDIEVLVGVENVSEAVRARSTLARIDYADTVTVATEEIDATPEQWMRAVLEESPIGQSAPRLWRAIGLRLGPRPSPDHIQGWKIAGRGADWIRVETSSWMMTGEAVVQVTGRNVSLALFLRYDSPVALWVWRVISVQHRRAVPVMLHQGMQVLRSRAAPENLGVRRP
jgi:hypothetical protein